MNFLRWHRRGGEAPAGSGEVAIVAAAGQIVGLGLVAVGLALEADAVIGLDAVAVAHHEHQPLGGVPQEEGQEEQFALLGGVYALRSQQLSSNQVSYTPFQKVSLLMLPPSRLQGSRQSSCAYLCAHPPIAHPHRQSWCQGSFLLFPPVSPISCFLLPPLYHSPLPARRSPRSRGCRAQRQ